MRSLLVSLCLVAILPLPASASPRPSTPRPSTPLSEGPVSLGKTKGSAKFGGILGELKTEIDTLDERRKALSIPRTKGPELFKRVKRYRSAASAVQQRAAKLLTAVKKAKAKPRVIVAVQRLESDAAAAVKHAGKLGNELDKKKLARAGKLVGVVLRDRSTVIALLEPIVSR